MWRRSYCVLRALCFELCISHSVKRFQNFLFTQVRKKRKLHSRFVCVRDFVDRSSRGRNTRSQKSGTKSWAYASSDTVSFLCKALAAIAPTHSRPIGLALGALQTYALSLRFLVSGVSKANDESHCGLPHRSVSARSESRGR